MICPAEPAAIVVDARAEHGAHRERKRRHGGPLEAEPEGEEEAT
jgi:hypothetical protein